MATRTDTHFDFGFRNSDCRLKTAGDVAATLSTADVYEIVRVCKLKIEYGHWQPVTAGEFELKAKVIRVNLNAVEQLNLVKEKIIAHELGHYFARNLQLSKIDEEKFCDEFAEELLNL